VITGTARASDWLRRVIDLSLSVIDLSLSTAPAWGMSRPLKLWLPVLLWMGVIFVASSDSGNFEHSSRIIGPVLRWLFPAASTETIGQMHHFLRKAGHFTEYAILALLAMRALRLSKPDRSWILSAVLALALSAAYAATDELHQSYVPGRTAAAGDVVIDIAGAVTALAVAALWRRRGEKPLIAANGPSGAGPSI
jgi:VanZ family protein